MKVLCFAAKPYWLLGHSLYASGVPWVIRTPKSHNSIASHILFPLRSTRLSKVPYCNTKCTLTSSLALNRTEGFIGWSWERHLALQTAVQVHKQQNDSEITLFMYNGIILLLLASSKRWG
jgi:hypothetical protein